MLTINNIKCKKTYTSYINTLLRNKTTNKKHFKNDILTNTFFTSDIVGSAHMLLLKKATDKINNILK